MSYTALYRKFRPAEFEDVKGQDHIITTLKNQIKADRIGHAYLFCGTRGTGKTTVARIMTGLLYEDFCKGSQLRASGRRKSLRGMYHVQKYCSRYFHERH